MENDSSIISTNFRTEINLKSMTDENWKRKDFFQTLGLSSSLTPFSPQFSKRETWTFNPLFDNMSMKTRTSKTPSI